MVLATALPQRGIINWQQLLAFGDEHLAGGIAQVERNAFMILHIYCTTPSRGFMILVRAGKVRLSAALVSFL